MSTSGTPTVWIVDDDEDDQYLFKLAFKQLVPPVAVKLLSDGEELLPALTECDTLPSLVILDLNMPRVNGFDALKQVRAEANYQAVPVVVLTTSTQYEDRERAERLGANSFLTKPPSMDELLKVCGQLVQTWRLK